MQFSLRMRVIHLKSQIGRFAIQNKEVGNSWLVVGISETEYI